MGFTHIPYFIEMTLAAPDAKRSETKSASLSSEYNAC
jgi:hypothetical protein